MAIYFNMSFFQEQDDFIKKAFQTQYNQDSDDEFEDKIPQNDKLDGNPEKKPKLADEEKVAHDCVESTYEKTKISLNVDGDKSLKESPECIELDSDSGNQVIETNHPSTSGFEDVITISSDSSSDTELSSFQIEHSLTNLSYDQDDYDFNLKLTLNGVYKQFRTTYGTKLSDALKDLLHETRSQGRELVITSQFESVSLDETPRTLKLTPGDILKAIEVTNHPSSSGNNPNLITVKLQDGHRKHTKEFRILKNQPTLELKKSYAKEFNLDNIDKIRLMFDGDVMDDNSTADDLEIEDDCVIDVVVVN